jgi:hypothetical protein
MLARRRNGQDNRNPHDPAQASNYATAMLPEGSRPWRTLIREKPAVTKDKIAGRYSL